MLFVSFSYKKKKSPWSKYTPGSMLISEISDINNAVEYQNLVDYLYAHVSPEFIPTDIQVRFWKSLG